MKYTGMLLLAMSLVLLLPRILMADEIATLRDGTPIEEEKNPEPIPQVVDAPPHDLLK